jgi:4-amino-4-deoxy-L-arabinose transferase-like glycosyltransferase
MLMPLSENRPRGSPWRSHRTALGIAALLFCCLVAAGLRLWGIDYGIPHSVARPDEETILQTAFNLVGQRNLDPGFFEYPSLSIYANALALEGYYRVGKLRGRYDSLPDFLFDAVVSRPGLTYRIGRTLSVGLALLTVVATFGLAREYSGRATTALWAALLISVAFLHVVFSRFVTVDVAMVLFTTGALYFCLRVARTGSTRDFVLTGILAGLAASAKYNGAVVGLALCPAALFARGGLVKRTELAAAGGKLALAALAAMVAFAATSPYALANWDAVQAGFTKHGYFYSRGPDPLGLWVHLWTTFPLGLGWPLYAVSLLGLALAIRRRRAQDWVLIVFFVSFLALIGGVRVVYPRYALPLVPVLIVLAADTVGRYLGGVLATSIGIAVLALPNVVSAISFDRLASQRDTRLLATDWIAENLPRRTAIALCQGYGAPEINADRRRPPAFEPKTVACRPEAIQETRARYLVTHEHPALTKYSSVDLETKRWLEQTAAVRARFDPFREKGSKTPYFYFSDAFYLPLAGFVGVTRGGPVITIWELGIRH